jgi:superfamily II DNA or RNA helicase
VLGVAATGAGKTVIFIKLLTDLMDQQPGARCVVLAHREELIHQPIERLARRRWRLADERLARPPARRHCC